MYIGLIYILLIVLTCFLLAKDRKNLKKYKNINNINPKDKKLAILIVLSVIFLYYIIGHIFKTDILNFITFRKHGVTYSFIGLLLLIGTSLFIGYIIEVIMKKRK